MKKLNSKGFSAVEVLLVMLIVAVLGGIGYYIYQARNKTDVSSSTAKTENSTQAAEKDEQAQSKEEAKTTVAIKDWNVKITQPTGETVVVSTPMGADNVTGALGTVYVYVPKYDKNYTCGSSDGETNKAKVVTIQKFSSNSNIESNTKNQPDVTKTVGNYKYGIYGIKQVTECYDAATAPVIQSLISQYLKDISVSSS